MIAIDTNVLLRYLLHDDVKQSSKASKLINGAQSVLVTHVVLAETLWTLCGKKYRAKQSDIVATVQALFEEPNIVLENPKVVWRALGDYLQANEKQSSKIDFPDALILNCAKEHAEQNDIALDGFYTFDKAAQKLPESRAP